MRNKYELNQETLTLRKAKSDCETALTEAIIAEDREKLIELTRIYYDILVAMAVQRKLAYEKKKAGSLKYYYNKKNNS